MLPCSLIHAYIPLYLTMEIWMIIKILVLQWNWFILLVHCHVHWNSLKLPKSTNIEATFRQFLPTLQKIFYLKMSEHVSCIFGEQKVKCYWWWSRNMMAFSKFLFHYHRYLKIMKILLKNMSTAQRFSSLSHFIFLHILSISIWLKYRMWNFS